MYSGPPVAAEDVISVYVILNGSLHMSPGKMAAQSFHCGWLCRDRFVDKDWTQQGRRVVVRLAETPHAFQRVMEECKGVAQQDEGLTEVQRGAITAFVTIPYRRADIPKILTHKKVQLF